MLIFCLLETEGQCILKVQFVIHEYRQRKCNSHTDLDIFGASVGTITGVKAVSSHYKRLRRGWNKQHQLIIVTLKVSLHKLMLKLTVNRNWLQKRNIRRCVSLSLILSKKKSSSKMLFIMRILPYLIWKVFNLFNKLLLCRYLFLYLDILFPAASKT